MKLSITHQESFSRSELLLRLFFGVFYIVLPHNFILFFLGLWGGILSFIAFWIILFTGRYPQSMFEYQEQLLRWRLRLKARISNLADGYPAFGLTATDEHTSLEIPYPERVSRGLTLIRFFFGWLYVALPHFFILFFRVLWGGILNILAFWVVLFTGKFPASWHTFLVENIRWVYRVALYLGNMTDEYPPFNGRA
ncbi:DUF4389 domain-containing protein [Flavobacteriaceae bacterium]|nr:DUF4389 domain-containing protein [Flavobacteriaceae bacterium]MDC0386718.1 DUF4389 domain-containing protein [Flavobacteriaceae bacterium]